MAYRYVSGGYLNGDASNSSVQLYVRLKEPCTCARGAARKPSECFHGILRLGRRLQDGCYIVYNSFGWLRLAAPSLLTFIDLTVDQPAYADKAAGPALQPASAGLPVA